MGHISLAADYLYEPTISVGAFDRVQGEFVDQRYRTVDPIVDHHHPARQPRLDLVAPIRDNGKRRLLKERVHVAQQRAMER
ncbi:MAG: hypothetical protein ACAH22_02260 [Tardiphaga sp.]